MRILLILFCIATTVRGNDSTQLKLKAFPSEKMVGIFSADARAHRLGFSRNFDGNNYGISMGNIFPVLNAKKGKAFAQLNVAGSTYLTLLRLNQAGSVLNSDYFADVFVDLSFQSPFILRLGTGHSSQHLSDDAIVSNLYSYQNYAKDYHQITGIYQTQQKNFLAYAGLFYNYNFKTSSNISNKQLWQMGFLHYPFKNKHLKSFFYGADIKFREELNFDHSLNMQVGYAIKSEDEHAIRLAFNYSQGTDERGYFHPAQRNFAHVGIYFEY
ncbi:MAG: DUF1207 domain-containing protein [Bacteroidia bacterium]|nr:DUF1207 domain-containing protein [Bacteroidia bacterium]